MSIIDSLFDSLKINLNIVGIQFLIIVALYFILDFLFFKKLLFVLLHRESKTTKLEEEANKKLVEAESLSSEYNKKLQDLAAEVYKNVQGQKQEIDEKEKESLKKAEDQINTEVDKQRKIIREEVEMKREGVFQNKESLSTTLVDKLIN